MPEKRLSLTEFLASYDRTLDKAHVEAAEQERKQILERFPLHQWATLSLQKYALGQESSDDTFCRWMEFRSQHLGSIRGGSARKLIIYKHKDKPGWYFDSAYKDEEAAWQGVRAAFIQAFQLAKAADWNSIDDLAPLRGGSALKLKVLHAYFPQEMLPIYSQQHLRHFLRLLDRPEADDRNLDVVRLSRSLHSAARAEAGLKEWSTNEIERLFYRWADPRDQRRIVKIAPGENARFWEECRRAGYICVGWDEVGDLREFETKEAFQARFDQTFAELHKNHRPTLTKKANELWTLTELEPGDLVVANQGTSKVLAIGEVTEPYAWDAARPEYRHTVRVKWDTSCAKEIAPQKKWAMVTVADVPMTLYESIAGDTPAALPISLFDRTHRDIAAALERKGQVILYGPPGTGKTFHARRFAVSWLLQHAGRDADAHSVLADPAKLAAVEAELSTVQVSRHVWWVVANPKEWSWDRLFKEKVVAYRYGRLRRNYPLAKPGDLVVGYQSTPDKRIVALARVSKALGTHAGKEPTIELVPVARVKNGLTYDELADDALLKRSEPMRFRNQGTLFALTEEEGEHVLSLLVERDPELEQHVEGEDAVGPLTCLTFHPSYSYEDFVEGFRPVETNDRSLSLRLSDGVFKRVCQAALAQPKKKFLLLVDEINRANLAKVFGELITLLERDKRGMMVTLPQSKEGFCIPPNVFLLGTMNTSDKSIKLLDAALRRRFAFIELMPDVSVFDGAEIGPLALDTFLERLNRRIAKTEGREKQIGHSFLMRGDQPITEPEELAHHFRQDILPLLQEFCYDDYGALARFVGDKLVDKDAHTLNQKVLDDPQVLVDVLAEEFEESEGDIA